VVKKVRKKPKTKAQPTAAASREPIAQETVPNSQKPTEA
jgi:hypothetical protein